MYKIKFNVEGWRGIIAKDFTVESVARIASAVATWLTRKHKSPTAVLGHDTRFGGEMFMEIVAKILAAKGVKVFVPEDFVTSPMVSLGTVKLSAQCGLLISASHYPAEYNGIKIKNTFGAPLAAAELKDIETLMPNEPGIDLELISWNAMLNQQMIQYIDLENVYIKEIHDRFNIDNIKSAAEHILIDPMFGSAQRLLKKLFGDKNLIHAEVNPTFKGIAPNTNFKNLSELATLIETDSNLQMGIALDGDADRIAMLDAYGNMIDSHQIILLLIHYLAGYKKQKGKILVSYPVTTLVETLCTCYNLQVVRSDVGFIEISRRLQQQQDYLLGTEDNGGIALKTNILERDALWVGFTLLEMVWTTQKSIQELITEIIEITGEFVCLRKDIPLPKKDINQLMKWIAEMDSNWHDMTVTKMDNQEVFKFSKAEHNWALLRPSGKEAALRVYFHAGNNNDLDVMYNALMKFIKQFAGS